MKRCKKMAALLLALICALSLVACGSNGQTASNPSSAPVSDASSAEPEGTPTLDAIKAKGELVVGTSADYPPMSSTPRLTAWTPSWALRCPSPSTMLTPWAWN